MELKEEENIINDPLTPLTVVLGLGSNYGQRKEAVEAALRWLEDLLIDFRKSGIYETPPVGHAGSDYVNAVAAGVSRVSVEQLERCCKEYEIAHGRDAEARRNNRVPIDIDIVIAGKDILRPRDFNCEFFQIGYEALGFRR